MNSVRSILELSTAILRDRPMRRKVMFYCSLVTVGLLFLGVVVLMRPLSQSPPAFLLYWLFCLGGALFMVLLAIYDILAVQTQKGEELARMRQSMVREIHDEGHGEAGGKKSDEES